jgi:hypothetical protein
VIIIALSVEGMECPIITKSNCPFLQASTAAEKPTADSTFKEKPDFYREAIGGRAAGERA